MQEGNRVLKWEKQAIINTFAAVIEHNSYLQLGNTGLLFCTILYNEASAAGIYWLILLFRCRYGAGAGGYKRQGRHYAEVPA